jgi:hypothetical protein
MEQAMSDTVSVRPIPVAPFERYERAGRRGHKFSDGSILWDNGEREYPTSGKTDEQKRNEARLAAGEDIQPTKPGVSNEEVRALESVGFLIADPHKMAQLRRADAKANAGKPPAEERALAPSHNEVVSNFRSEAKRLLEREIDRLEELKTMAIAGQIELAIGGVPLVGRNPPMQLHELVLETIRLSDQGNPDQLLAQLRKVRQWTSFGAPRVDELPYPPPDGYPSGGTAPPLPPPDSQPGLNPASQALGPGGQPTVYNAPTDPLAPPPVTGPLTIDQQKAQAKVKAASRQKKK